MELDSAQRSAQKAKLCRDVGTMMLLDMVLGVIILCFIIDSNEGVYDCSPKLFMVGASFLIY